MVVKPPSGAAGDVTSVTIVGSPISELTVDKAIATIAGWIGQSRGHYVCVADVHSVMRARSDERHRLALRHADMVTPDGTPLVWFARLKGSRVIRRVSGPDLMLAICAASVARNWSHYLYGGKPDVPKRLAAVLQRRYPGIEIAGSASPPFRVLTEAEDAEVVSGINSVAPDIIWVSLGCPKQERWMAEHRERFPGAVLIGVGAAFDFHVGDVRRAPQWMRSSGLEWLHRLCSEPRRLWRRYLVLAPLFVWFATTEWLTELGTRWIAPARNSA